LVPFFLFGICIFDWEILILQACYG